MDSKINLVPSGALGAWGSGQLKSDALFVIRRDCRTPNCQCNANPFISLRLITLNNIYMINLPEVGQ